MLRGYTNSKGQFIPFRDQSYSKSEIYRKGTQRYTPDKTINKNRLDHVSKLSQKEAFDDLSRFLNFHSSQDNNIQNIRDYKYKVKSNHESSIRSSVYNTKRKQNYNKTLKKHNAGHLVNVINEKAKDDKILRDEYPPDVVDKLREIKKDMNYMERHPEFFNNWSGLNKKEN